MQPVRRQHARRTTRSLQPCARAMSVHGTCFNAAGRWGRCRAACGIDRPCVRSVKHTQQARGRCSSWGRGWWRRRQRARQQRPPHSFCCHGMALAGAGLLRRMLRSSLEHASFFPQPAAALCSMHTTEQQSLRQGAAPALCNGCPLQVATHTATAAQEHGRTHRELALPSLQHCSGQPWSALEHGWQYRSSMRTPTAQSRSLHDFLARRRSCCHRRVCSRFSTAERA